jgi:hypothetical protein
MDISPDANTTPSANFSGSHLWGAVFLYSECDMPPHTTYRGTGSGMAPCNLRILQTPDGIRLVESNTYTFESVDRGPKFNAYTH